MAFFLTDWIYYHACGSFPSSPGTCSLKSERWQQTIYTLHHRRFYHSVHAAATFRYPQWRVLSCEMTATHFKRFPVPFRKSILQQQEVTTPADPATCTSAAGLPCIPVNTVPAVSKRQETFITAEHFLGAGDSFPNSTSPFPSRCLATPNQIKDHLTPIQARLHKDADGFDTELEVLGCHMGSISHDERQRLHTLHERFCVMRAQIQPHSQAVLVDERRWPQPVEPSTGFGGVNVIFPHLQGTARG